jgi:hypothetical protein
MRLLPVMRDKDYANNFHSKPMLMQFFFVFRSSRLFESALKNKKIAGGEQ